MTRRTLGSRSLGTAAAVTWVFLSWCVDLAAASAPTSAVVGEQADYSLIQGAIDAAPGGPGWHTIFIEAGVYDERVVIPAGKTRLVLQGRGRDRTVIEHGACYTNGGGVYRARPVIDARADDLVVRAMTVRNLANEPGGCAGRWDAAFTSNADRVILDDVRLRGDHDTLLVYGPRKRVYVRDSHIQGRADFIASFTSVYIERSVLELIRNRGHILFQAGVPGAGFEQQDRMIVRDSVFTARLTDPRWPERVTNLWGDAVVYFIDNFFRSGLGASRPVLLFHDDGQPASSVVFRFGNVPQGLNASPLIWDRYSVPGPPEEPPIDRPIRNGGRGVPIVQALGTVEAGALTPAAMFGDWDPVAVLDEVTVPNARVIETLPLLILAAVAGGVLGWVMPRRHLGGGRRKNARGERRAGLVVNAAGSATPGHHTSG